MDNPMTNSPQSPTKSPTSPASPTSRTSRLRTLLEAGRIPELCRRDPNAFIQLCFIDSDGRRIRQAAVHRELQAFLTANPRALVDLPRDHGKSFQVCCRILWELGHDPGLRVKI